MAVWPILPEVCKALTRERGHVNCLEGDQTDVQGGAGGAGGQSARLEEPQAV